MNTKDGPEASNVVPLRPLPEPAPAPRVGRVVGVAEDGTPRVECEGGGPVPARLFATVDPVTLTEGAEVLLFFDRSDPRRPIIAGVLAPQVPSGPRSAESAHADLPDFVNVDGRRVSIEGKEEIVLRCGAASITLRKNGKVVIVGTFVESRSAGVQRIKGATVKVN